MDLNRFDPADNALKSRLHMAGAQNPRVIDKEQQGPNEWLYAVTADAWTELTPFNDGDVRYFAVEITPEGSAHITSVGYNLA